ncbi:hypothetical protein HDE_10679 [Halotydeus destructor]|nr:hypothetical protein HDE_10679 [Halotydeus destructor]
MIQLYLRYNIRADYSYMPPDKLITPALTICFIAPFRTQCSDANCPALKNSRLFFQNCFEPSDLFDNLTVLEGTTMTRIFGASSIGQWFDTVATKFRYDGQLCFTLNIRARLNISYDRTLFEILERPYYMMLLLEPSQDAQNVFSFFGPEMEMVSSLSSMFAAFKHNYITFHTYSYEEIVLLPAPYKTNCRDYGSIYKTQEGCYNQCRLFKSLSKFDGVPFKIPYLKSDSIPYRKKPFSKADYEEMADCGRRCSQNDCHITVYKPVSTENVNYMNITGAILSFESGPQLFVRYVPNMTIAEFGALIGSIECLWLGFSVLSLSKLL